MELEERLLQALLAEVRGEKGKKTTSLQPGGRERWGHRAVGSKHGGQQEQWGGGAKSNTVCLLHICPSLQPQDCIRIRTLERRILVISSTGVGPLVGGVTCLAPKPGC